MGVKGLWRLIAPVGKPVSLESLDGKILAVDVSIWLNKAAKGMRDKYGNAIYNAHLVMMFHRICKLLFYGIKPVFVFDGGVPELKKRTLKLRRERRTRAETGKKKTKELMLKNYLQTKALEAVSGTKSTTKLNLLDKKEKEDIFLLPEMPSNEASQSDSSSDDDMINEDEWLQTLNEHHVQVMFDQPDTVDIDSAEFSSLPAEVKHELLTEIKDSHRRRYKRKNEEDVKLPDAADDFSNFQLKNLKKRGHITQQIDALRKEMNSSMTAQFITLYQDFDQQKYKNHHVEGKRYASNEKQSYILVKNMKNKEENALFKSSLDDEYNRFKEKESTSHNSHLFKRLEREPAQFQSLMEQNKLRKRLASESSEDMELQPLSVIRNSNQHGDIDADNVPGPSRINVGVEYMSPSSSDQSDGEKEGVEIQVNEPVVSNKGNTLDSPGLQNRSGEKINIENTDSAHKVFVDESDTSANKAGVSANKIQVSDITVGKTKVSQSEADMSVGKTIVSESEVSVKVDPVSMSTGKLNFKLSKDLIQKDKLLDRGIDDNKLNVSVEQRIDPNDQSVVASIESNLETIAPKAPETQPTLLSPTISIPSDVSSPNVEEELSENDLHPKDDIVDITTEQGGGRQEAIEPKESIDVSQMQQQLEEEHKRLEEDSRKQSRQAATLSSETYQDVQELLRLFGIPYLVSPAEAEAQCAQLDYSKLTDGSITDDFDIFLFGGSRVYKNIFNQKKFAEMYSADDLIKSLYLTRDKLIALAFLTGSDYTEGVQGVGSVTGMEILQEFARSKSKETLKLFKEWLSGKTKDFNPGNNLKTKLRNIQLPGSFNSSAVWEAYLSPTVETSDESFEWGNPDVDAIKEFASEKFGWLYSRTDEILKPVIENLLTKRKRQKTLKAYFQPKLSAEEPNVTSKRLQKILNKVATSQHGGSVTTSDKKTDSASKRISKKKSDSDNEGYFEDSSIDEGLLTMSFPTSNIATTSSATQRQNRQHVVDDERPTCSKRRKVSYKLDPFTPNVSSNKHVQAQKISNLIKAAEESLKPQTPFVAMQHVNNIVWNRLKGKGNRALTRRRKNQKQKLAASLIEAAQSSSVVSSESDSD